MADLFEIIGLTQVFNFERDRDRLQLRSRSRSPPPHFRLAKYRLQKTRFFRKTGFLESLKTHLRTRLVREFCDRR
ncbi:hypothetical protein QT972_15615 [Microcoleus sp. herbarium7]|uniref:hypothetical protein n=1 Tax=Microcoleus sp. herbarium13 TaxID=3055438 RepID=UPI002FD01535